MSKQYITQATRRASLSGYVLLPVVLLITLLATVAFLLNNQTTLENNIAHSTAEVAQARYVAEAGLNHAVKQANSSSCVAYPSPLNASFGSHTYTASVTPTSGSPVSVTSKGVLAATPTQPLGASQILTRDNIRIYQPTTIEILQPGAEGKDTHIYQWKNNWNFGADPNLVVSFNIDSSQNSLLQFDLSAIPAGVEILSASLEMYSNSNTYDIVTVNVHQVTTDWVEGSLNGAIGAGANWLEADTGVAWGSAGGDYAPTIIASTVTSGSMGWFNWDISQLVDTWVNGSAPNYGLVLNTTQFNKGAQFSSGDAVTASLRPKLTITYTCECGVSAANSDILQPDGATGKDTNIHGDQSTRNYGAKVSMSIYDAGNARPLLEFDLSYIPAGASIQSAQLGLYVKTVISAGSLDVHRLTSSWLEGTCSGTSSGCNGATWDTADGSLLWSSSGGDYDTTIIDSANISSSGVWINLDVTALADGWVSGAFTNQGLLLMPGGGIEVDLQSSDAATERPRLTINYTCPCGVVCGGGSPPPVGYYDEFNSLTCVAATDYIGSDGTLDWSGFQWQEQDNGDPCSGSVWLLEHQGSNRLAMTSAIGWIERKVDLSAFTGGTLDFDYLQIGALNSSQYSSIKFSGDNGSSWTELGRIDTPGDGTTYLSASYVIPQALVNADSMLRFENNLLLSGRAVYFDNVKIVDTGAPPNNLLLVVGNATTLSTKDLGYKARMESWGYTVSPIDDGDSQSNFDTAMATANVVYVSGSSSGSALLDKVTNTTTGVVNELNGKIDNFGFSSSTGASTLDSVLVNSSATHYISSPFGGGNITVFSSALSMPVPSGTLAPDLDTVAQAGGYSALATLDSGAIGWDGNPVTARRVHLPFAPADASDLTADGETVLQRALEWAAGAGAGGGGGGGGPPPSTDGPAFEDSTETALGINGKNLSINKPSGTVAGDLLVVAVATDGEQKSPMTAPAGWTLISHENASKQVTMDVLWKIAGASEPASYDFSWVKSQEAYAWMMRFTGHDAANPINVFANAKDDDPSPISPAVTTTVDNAMILRLGGFDDDDITIGDPGLTGHTAINMNRSSSGTGTVSGGSGYVLQAVAGNSGTSNFALTSSEQYVTVTIAIAPAP